MLAAAIITTVVVGYLLGNLNGAVLISTLFRKEDVRTKGSGNAGATNYYRNYGKKGTLPVLLIDILKACAACWLGALLFWAMGIEGQMDTAKMLGGSAAVLGHMFPVFLHFRGGKGILSAASVLLMMHPGAFGIAFGLFILFFVIFHYVSLSSIVAAVSYGPLLMLFFWGNWWVIGLGYLLAVLAIFMHRANVGRLLSGTESKTFLRKK